MDGRQASDQSELIRNWQPWNRSTGPKTADGKAAASRSACKGGRVLDGIERPEAITYCSESEAAT